jgi:hypothetical protein
MKSKQLITAFTKLRFFAMRFLQKIKKNDKDNFSNNPYYIL